MTLPGQWVEIFAFKQQEHIVEKSGKTRKLIALSTVAAVGLTATSIVINPQAAPSTQLLSSQDSAITGKASPDAPIKMAQGKSKADRG